MAQPPTSEGTSILITATDVVIQMLRDLVEASDFNCFIPMPNATSDLRRSVMDRIPLDNLRLIVKENNYSILEALIRAAARGLELADKQVSILTKEGNIDHLPAVTMVQLVGYLARCLESDEDSADCRLKMDSDLRKSMHVRAAVMMKKSGMLDVLPQIYIRLKDCIVSRSQHTTSTGSATTQQQQDPQMISSNSSSALQALAAFTMDVLSCLAYVWPEERRLFSPALLPFLPAAADLAMAAAASLQNQESNPSNIAIAGHWAFGSAGARLAVSVVSAVRCCIVNQREVPQAATHHHSILQLLLLHMSNLVRDLTQKKLEHPEVQPQSDTLPPQPPSRPIPEHHHHLLKVLAISNDRMRWPTNDPVSQLQKTIALLGDKDIFGSLLLAVVPGGSGSSSSSSSTGNGISSKSALEPPLVAGHAASAVPALMVPAMLTMLEGALLLQQEFPEMLLIVLGSMQLPLGTLVATPTRSYALVQQILEEVLPELVQLLPLAKDAQSKVLLPLADTCVRITRAGLQGPNRSAGSLEALAAVFRQHTEQYSMLLELHCRALLRNEGWLDMLECVQQTAHTACQLLGLAVETASVTKEAADSGETAASGAPSSSFLAASPASQQQVFAALLTAVKIGTVISKQEYSDKIMLAIMADLKLLYHTMMAVMAVLWCGGSSSSSNRADNTAAAAASSNKLWYLLLARCLMSIGRELQFYAEHLKDEHVHHHMQCYMFNQQDPNNFVTAMAANLPLLLCMCRAAVGLMIKKVPLPASVPAAVGAGSSKQQADQSDMEKLLEALQACIPTYKKLVPSQKKVFAAGSCKEALLEHANLPLAPPTGQYMIVPPSHVADLGRLLEHCGAALCVQLPVAQCCNYHLCGNMEHRSEQQLVNGRNCICGRCKCARYCSQQCQGAHWQEWHRLLCKQLKQQMAQQRRREKQRQRRQQQQQQQQLPAMVANLTIA